jgi:hypothetical protein
MTGQILWSPVQHVTFFQRTADRDLMRRRGVQPQAWAASPKARTTCSPTPPWSTGSAGAA